ncbi:MAG: hypothetical protein ACRD03_10890 [Acidimicrobiales bacterium]
MATVFILMVVLGLSSLLVGLVYSRAGQVEDTGDLIAPLFKAWRVAGRAALRGGVILAALGLIGLLVMTAAGAFR